MLFYGISLIMKEKSNASALLSAQGREYPQNENPENYNGIKKEVRKQMQNGNRSFVEDETSILYDLSIPLYLLLK